MKQVILNIPQELDSLLSLDKKDELNLVVKDSKLYIRIDNTPKKKAIPVMGFVLPSILSSILFVFFFLYKDFSQINLTGDLSIASLSLSIGLLSGMVSFIVTFIKEKANKVATGAPDIYWRNLPAIVLSLTIVLFLFLLTFFKIIGLMFKDSSFDLFTSAFLFFVFVTIINYIMLHFALTITPSLLINLMTVVFILGVGLSMVTNRDYLWWHNNFSFLGTAEAKHRWEFNLTLVLTSILMLALIDYIFIYLKRVIDEKKRLATLKLLLVLTAINLGGVGVFPYSQQSFSGNVHNFVAANLVYLIVILIISIRWLLPQISKQFLRMSYLLGSLLVLSCILFQGVHYFSLTAFELISFLVSFTWLLLLLQMLQSLMLFDEYKITFTVIEQKGKLN